MPETTMTGGLEAFSAEIPQGGSPRKLPPILQSLVDQLLPLLQPVAPPVGSVFVFAGSTPPPGYLVCEGQAVSRQEFKELFGLVGETWGKGDGQSTFNLPDLRGRVVLGAGQGPGLSPRLLAQTAGSEVHALSVAELPRHNHRGKILEAGGHEHTARTSPSGTHTHPASISEAKPHTHGGSTGGANPCSYRVVDPNNPGHGAQIAENHVTGYLGGTCADHDDVHFPLSYHTHPLQILADGQHSHTLTLSSDGAHGHAVTIDPQGTHSHEIQIDEGSSCVAAPFALMPPSAVLQYIIRAKPLQSL